MGGSPQSRRPAQLPGGAPEAIREFVACTTDRVQLDLSELDWIPKPPGVPDELAPGVSILDGATSTSATIRVGYGPFISIELPTTIVDGELHIDSSGLGFNIGDNINPWVDAFNRTLRENGKQLEGLSVDGNKVTLTKRAIPAAATDGASSVAPTGTATASTPTATSPTASTPTATTPAPEPSESTEVPGSGCLKWVIGGIVAAAVAIGLTLGLTGGEDSDKVATKPAGSSSSSSSTSSTSPSSTTTSTLVEVGQVIDPEPEEVPAAAVCGTFPNGSERGNSDEFLMIEGPSSCEPTEGSYTACNAEILPCSTEQSPPFVLTGGAPGIDHTRSVPDAITGQEGASTASFLAFVRLFTNEDSALMVYTSDCGGNIVTGSAPVNSGGLTTLDQPLISFGFCNVASATIVSDDPSGTLLRQIAELEGREYTVGTAQPDPEPPLGVELYVPSNERFQVEADWADASLTVVNTFASEPLTRDCLWFFAPDETDALVKVLDGCSNPNNFWVFAAATTNVEVTLMVADTLTGTAASFTNPLGTPFPPAADTEAFATSDALFDNTIYPCGYGHVAYTACADGEPAMETGAFVTVAGAMLDTIPIDSDGTNRSHTIDFTPVGGPAYTVAQDIDGWTVVSSAGETRARALFRDNSLTLVAPHDELPAGELSYIWSTTVDGATHAQPVVPVIGVITTPTILAE